MWKQIILDDNGAAGETAVWCSYREAMADRRKANGKPKVQEFNSGTNCKRLFFAQNNDSTRHFVTTALLLEIIQC